MTYTTNPHDSELGHGVDKEPVPQNKKYLILSDEERAKGFIRPVHRAYVHVGIGGHEIDPTDMSKHGRTGEGCGVLTSMGIELCETYARDPKFYGSTYCVGCKKHLPVAEFLWDGTTEEVGS